MVILTNAFTPVVPSNPQYSGFNIRSIIQANTSLRNSFLAFEQTLLDSMYTSKKQILTEVPEQKLL